MDQGKGIVNPGSEPLSPLKRALIALQELRARLDSAESAKREPIAIVGAGCRFPGGVTDLDSYWRLLQGGVDAITEIPAERWDVDAYYDPDPTAPGKMATRCGGFLDGVDRFDPAFFGVSPREAVSMDPQQRLLLEVAWEALENAGIPAQKLARSRTGVFVGICSNDYLRHHLSGPEQLDAYISSGNAHSIAAGRLSYTLGLQGPCMAIDTACSSSLVAVHLAVQSLRTGESELALAGGVNLILAPDGTVALSQAQMLAPDGRCRTFDAAAAGYGRSEGCGVVVLKRLADAQRDQDRILAVIRGSAVNQDGRSNGLTAPNGLAQQEVIRAALANAGVDASEIGYIETHGTGTALGDPMEVEALQAVFGRGRSSDKPLLLGSVKTNFGHLETAAGVAGLLKAALALRHGEIPPHLHLHNPSPHIPWERLPMAVPTRPTAWPGTRLAGASSFGYSGTNAHLVLEAPPEEPAPPTSAPERPRHILALSARHPESLRALAEAHAEKLAQPGASLPDLAYTANAGRAHWAHRLAVSGVSPEDVRRKLLQWLAGETPKGVRGGERRDAKPPSVGFLLTGQGAQYAGMGRRLYETEPVFRAALERCDAIARPLLARPLLEVLFADDAGGLIDRTDYTQPALFALEYALAQMWQSWGVRPAALLGHSIGEYVAACLAGVFSLEDGLRLVAARGRLMQELAADGAMAAVFAPESAVTAAIEPFAGRLSPAAVNGPAEVVISGERSALEQALAALQAQGVRTKPLQVSQAFHSPLLEPMLGAFEAVAAEVRYAPPQLVVISNLTGRRAEEDDLCTPGYWVRQTRSAVRFADGVRALADEGCETLLEIGPRATLLGLAQQNLTDREIFGAASLRPGQDDWEQALDSLGALYAQGVDVDWEALDRGRDRRRVDAPLYPFNRQRYWPAPSRAATRSGGDASRQPLLDSRLTLPLREQVFESRFFADAPAYLSDHRIQGLPVAPGALYLELALEAAVESLGPGPRALLDIRFEEPLPLQAAEGEALDTVLSPDSDAFQVFRRAPAESGPGGAWRTLASGRLAAHPATPSAEPPDAVRERCPQALDPQAYYRRLAALGLDYGPRFRGLTELNLGAGEVLARVRLPEALAAEAERYQFHPALLDTCLQSLGAALLDVEDEATDHSYVLAGVAELRLHRTPGASLQVHARLRRDSRAEGSGDRAIRGDLTIFDEEGAVVAEALGVRVQRVESAALRRSAGETAANVADWFYGVEWREIQPSAPAIRSAGAEVPSPGLAVDLGPVRERFQLDAYEALLPELDALSGAWARAALNKLGWSPGKTPDELGVAPEHRRLFTRMVAMLAEDDRLGRAADADPLALRAELAARFPPCGPELTLLERCGLHLADVLQGKVGALPVLFPEGSLALLEQAYAEEPFARAGNAVLEQAVDAALAEAPPDRPLRILEIGAGTGGTTQRILPHLPTEAVEYVFTDLSQLFLRKAREKFRDYGFVDYKLLDIERDPVEQGFAEGSFDIVLAANVLHATRDLRQTLRRVRRLLAPTGRLLLLEGTAPQRKTDLIFGLTQGWWLFEDRELRPEHALLPARDWLRLLTEEGFGAADALPDPSRTESSPWSAIVTRPVAPEGPAWAIVGDGDGLAGRLSALLAARGQASRRLPAGQGAAKIPEGCLGVIHLAALDSAAPPSFCGSALDVVQQLSERRDDGGGRVWLVTRGAQPAGGPVTAGGLASSTLWGLGRVAANELPESWGGLADLDPRVEPAAQAEALLAAIYGAGAERELALRDGAVLAPRLVRRPKPSAEPLTLRADGAYLVTGGLGGLGLAAARWLVEKGARRLILCGRKEPSAAAQTVIEELRSLGATVTAETVDVSRRDQLDALLARLGAEPTPLRGVLHAAGTYDDGMLAQQSWARFAGVLAPKLTGAWNLHRATEGLPLDFFVLFGSASALLGAPGQSSYAAGNAFLDALAHYRRAAGLPALAVDWGAWAEVGRAAQLSAPARKRLEEMGFRPLPPAAAFDCLEALLPGQGAQAAVLSVRWGTYLERLGPGPTPPFLEDLAAEASAAEAPAAPAGSWRARIAAAQPADRSRLMLALVREQAAKVLRLDRAQALGPREPLQALGLDSLMAVELRNGLSQVVGRSLPSTLAFDYPTIEALAGYLQKTDWPSEAPAPAKPVAAAAPSYGGAEPIAILGAACRIPGGANDLEAFWELLRNETDAVREVPADRWDIEQYYDPDPDAPGKMYTRWGGFLGPVDGFDAAFFGVSPREALSMDPQQRLLLETAWEALENAGQAADRLQGSQTGVFVGISAYDYYHLQRRSAAIDAYTGSGVTFSVAAGRLAYVLGLQGPTMAVDTACSSSLVTIHLACQSLRNRECDLALAGGVNLILSPENTIYSCRLHALAADGRCKTFDARANGYVRGEGCGMTTLKRLSDALRDGDPILAVIRGSAVNQDGRSNGLTAPNGPAQEAVIRKALASGGVRPEEVSYVEAHGTGTPLGDPIELQALGATLGAGRAPDELLLVGSLKTNIGHLESAAGVTSLLKAALVVRHGEIPAHLHLREGNPFIRWDELPIRIPSALTPWPNGRRRLAGVSSFGYSGTNAHAILEQPPEPAAVATDNTPAGRTELLALSARSEDSLRALAEGYRRLLSAPNAPLRDIAYTAAVRRSHHERRLALVGASAEELVEGLTRYLDGGLAAGASGGVCVPGASHKTVFVFPGQGSQWLGMGRELLEAEPAFRQAFERCDAAVRAEAGWSPLEELRAAEESSRLAEIEVVQPLLFAVQVALAAQWRSWGVEPDAVVGHSMGEVAAAHVAGVLTLEDAAKIICRRSRLLRRVSGRGAMAVVELSADEARQAMEESGGLLSVAVSNSPRSTVLAGDPAALQALLERLEARGVFCRKVKVDVASHSPYVDELREDLLAALADLEPSVGSIPLYSTVEAERVDGAGMDAAYWVRNLREPVRFSESVGRLLADEHDLFVEISPHPVLLPAIEDNIRHTGVEARAAASLRRAEPERGSLLASLGALYAQGYAVDWARVYPAGRFTPVPTYPWDRRRYWITDEAPANEAAVAAATASSQSPLGVHLESALQPGTHLWEREIGPRVVSYLADHKVEGLATFPAAGFLDLALAGAQEAFGDGVRLEQASFERMLLFPEDASRRVQLAITGAAGDAAFQILSASDGWTLHARGRVRAARGAAPAGASIGAIQARCPEVCSGAELYAALAARGLGYGPAFQGVEQLWRGAGEALSLVRPPRGAELPKGRRGVHPALLDACFHGMGMAIGPDGGGRVFVPASLDALEIHGDPAATRWSHIVLRPSGEIADADELTADIRLLDESGRVVAEVQGLSVKALERADDAGKDASDDWLYELAWEERPTPEPAPKGDGTGRWLLVADRGGMGAALAEALRARGEAVELVFATDDADALRTLAGRPEGWSGVVYLGALDADAAVHDAGLMGALHLAQALAAAGRRDAPRLWLVTRGAQPAAPGEAPTVGQAPLWGFGRSLSYEHPELLCTKVDLDPQSADIAGLAAEITASDREDQIALRGGRRWAARLRRWRPQAQEERVTPAGDRPFRLEQQTPGVLDGLALRPMERRVPGPGEIEIEVRASGLNFLDVLLALGAIPNDVGSGEGMPLGSECSGRITALGAGVEGWEIGQEVLAIAPWSMGSHAIAPAELTVAKPENLSHEEAATIPVAFLTAYYALRHVARLAPGERVLIQAAAGGVGLAAVQVAQLLGAEIFATAGSEEKRERLRALGVAHVMDSRSLAFVEQVRAATGGEGVDVTLNSLSGEFIDAGLELLRDHGRFIEIGKRDYYANRNLGLQPFLRNLSLSLVDLRGMILKRPGAVKALLGELLALFEQGALRPLPYRSFPAAEAPEAFRWMAQARHIGKIVVSWEGREAALLVASDEPLARADGSYLITGGLGGLGLLTARWLVEQGARHLALLGRSLPSPEAAAEIEALRDMGAAVTTLQADVADAASLAAAVQTLDETLPPLAGVVHSAGLLDDGLIGQLSAARFAKVAAPKVAGAWNLHTLTQDRELDFFVLYSSGSSLLGAPGQANYAAANAFLDALAHLRRARGLPALSINWGAWAEVGLAAAQANRGERMAQGGFSSIPPAEGLATLGRLLRANPVQAGVLPLNLRQWRQSYPQLAETPLFQHLLDELDPDANAGQAGPVRTALAEAAPSERPSLLEAHLTEQLARVVRSNPAAIERTVSFQSLGLDSLMALELRNRLEAGLGLTLPVTMVWGYPNVAALAGHLLAELQLPVPTAADEREEAPVPEAEAAPALERIADLSDEEVERLFAARVRAREGGSQ
ncbi:MAG: SDR family NAD(P)-dependent oxidoreductase [Acidobacteria bacterium]|nr:SDR family NAD(P)-dependent oxidoreductase [Acidobacteriota bacterium]